MGAMKRLALKVQMDETLSSDEKRFLKTNDPTSYFRIYGGKVAIGNKNPILLLELFSVPQAIESPATLKLMDEAEHADWIDLMESEERERMEQGSKY